MRRCCMDKFKNVALSLAVIAGVTGLVFGATQAVFTTNATNVDNQIRTGSVALELDGTLQAEAPNAFFDVKNMMPGDSETSYIEIKNSGDEDLLFKTYLTNFRGTSGFANQLQATITLNPSNYDEPKLTGDLYGPKDHFVWTGSLADLAGASKALDNASAAFDDSWPLNPGYVAIYEVIVSLPMETGNEYQNAELIVDLRVDATQFANQNDDSIVW